MNDEVTFDEIAKAEGWDAERQVQILKGALISGQAAHDAAKMARSLEHRVCARYDTTVWVYVDVVAGTVEDIVVSDDISFAPDKATDIESDYGHEDDIVKAREILASYEVRGNPVGHDSDGNPRYDYVSWNFG